MKTRLVHTTIAFAALGLFLPSTAGKAADMVHDSEYYVLEAQNGEKGD